MQSISFEEENIFREEQSFSIKISLKENDFSSDEICMKSGKTVLTVVLEANIFRPISGI